MNVFDLKCAFWDLDNTSETSLDDFEIIIDSEERYQTVDKLTYNEKEKEITVHLVPILNKKGES